MSTTTPPQDPTLIGGHHHDLSKKNPHLSEEVHEIITSEPFQRLVATRWRVSLTLTALMLLVYFGFILTVAFNKAVLATKLGSALTVAIPIGLGIIVFAWLITGVYIRWANRYYDREVAALKQRI
jgi:uncharacterized membrane protein (DUF485 family)